ncbi:MAG: hypothetical protein CR985_03340 [Flavobacteriales bacterium]|nr:MAG: hypothetical protein CR985_03340 [Flavobacteriales bacterium]
MKRGLLLLLIISALALNCSKNETVLNKNTNTHAYYVSLSGNDSNDGRSEASAWRTISFAASSQSPILPGDTVYIKAGNYGNENVVFETDGLDSKPIVFEGYKEVPGDNPNLNWQYGDGLNENIMPLLNGGDRTTGIGIDITERKNIKLKNIQITNYSVSLYGWKIEGIEVDNIIAMSLGDVNKKYDGKGISFGSMANNNKIKNCIVLNACAEGISITGDNNYIDNCKVYSDDNSTGHKSATDYFIHINGNYNTIQNSRVERVGNLDHGGHGFSLKKHGQYNKIIGCTSKNFWGAGFQLRHRGVKNNLIENCTAIESGFTIRDGASNNLIRKCKTINAGTSVVFLDTVEDDGAQFTGRNNRFENCIFNTISTENRERRFWGNVISFSYYSEPSIADSNTFVNCTFDDGYYLFNIDRENNDNKMINCIVTNVKNFSRTAVYQNVSYPLNFDFEYCNFWNNNFSAPNGNSITEFNPEFIDAANYNYHLKSSSPCIDIGTTSDAPSDDFDGIARPQGDGIDIGAYEF